MKLVSCYLLFLVTLLTLQPNNANPSKPRQMYVSETREPNNTPSQEISLLYKTKTAQEENSIIVHPHESELVFNFKTVDQSVICLDRVKYLDKIECTNNEVLLHFSNSQGAALLLLEWHPFISKGILMVINPKWQCHSNIVNWKMAWYHELIQVKELPFASIRLQTETKQLSQFDGTFEMRIQHIFPQTQEPNSHSLLTKRSELHASRYFWDEEEGNGWYGIDKTLKQWWKSIKSIYQGIKTISNSSRSHPFNSISNILRLLIL